jgi:flagellar basal-body rod protein FlgF
MQAPGLVLLSDQMALSRAIDVVANNVANANTTGFKREAIQFDTQLVHPPQGNTIQFVTDRATYRDASTGPIQPTGNPFDLAIQGTGYMQVQMPDGSTRYTRGGTLRLDDQGQLTNTDGNPILSDGNSPITIPSTYTDVVVSGDGFISARVDNGVDLAQLGKIGVVTFPNEQLMQAEGKGLYSTKQIAAAATDSHIVQGAVEQSNVQPMTEITNLIQIQRAYEQTNNLIGQDNTRKNNAINVLSKTTV